MQPYPSLFAYLRAAGLGFLLIVGGMYFALWLQTMLGWQNAPAPLYVACQLIGWIPASWYICRELDVSADLIDDCAFACFCVMVAHLSDVLPPASWWNTLLSGAGVFLLMLQHVVRWRIRLKRQAPQITSSPV